MKDFTGDGKKVSGCATIGDISIPRYENSSPEMQSDTVDRDKISRDISSTLPAALDHTKSVTSTRLDLAQLSEATRCEAQRGVIGISINRCGKYRSLNGDIEARCGFRHRDE